MSQPDNMDGNLVKVLEWLRYLLPRDSSDALVTIDFDHHEIHEGCHFTATVYDADVDIAAPKYVRVTAPNTATRIHMILFVSGDGGFLFQFYENPTLLAAGAGVTAYNNDRNSGNAATATVFQDTTTQGPNNDGTLLDASYSGGEKKRVSGDIGSRDEWILKQDEDYLVKVTADADNTKITVIAKWYEES